MNTQAKASITATALLLALFAGLAAYTAPGEDRIDQTVVSAPVNQAWKLSKAFRADAEAAVKDTQIGRNADLASKPVLETYSRPVTLALNTAG